MQKHGDVLYEKIPMLYIKTSGYFDNGDLKFWTG